MKKVFFLFCLLILTSCEAGKLDDNRRKLHDMGHDENICQKMPSRCIDGVPW